MPTIDGRKSYKREVALGLLLGYCAAFGWTLFMLPFTPMENAMQMVSLMNGAAPWVVGLVGAMYGLDGYAKQIRGHNGGYHDRHDH